jgi:uncharacterized protein (TIGR02147 family)
MLKSEAMAQVFDFKDYRKFLEHALSEGVAAQRGAKARLAEAMGCQASYLSQVLKGLSDISLEQADRVNQFLGHTDEQSEFFLLLVTYARSGTESLRRQFARQIKREQDRYWNSGNRFKTRKQLSKADQQTYYSSWQFAAVAMALTVPRLRTKEALSSHFRIPLKRVAEVLEFLCVSGLAKETDGSYLPGESWIHTGNNPLLTLRDHANWRTKSLQAMDSPMPFDLRYSSVVSLSESDFLLIREKIIKFLQEIRDIIEKSKEEKVCSLLIDFFDV